MRWKAAFLCLAGIAICGVGYAILIARISAPSAFVLLIAATLCGVLAHIDRLAWIIHRDSNLVARLGATDVRRGGAWGAFYLGLRVVAVSTIL